MRCRFRNTGDATRLRLLTSGASVEPEFIDLASGEAASLSLSTDDGPATLTVTRERP
jgi:hypothetical protein